MVISWVQSFGGLFLWISQCFPHKKNCETEPRSSPPLRQFCTHGCCGWVHAVWWTWHRPPRVLVSRWTLKSRKRPREPTLEVNKDLTPNRFFGISPSCAPKKNSAWLCTINIFTMPEAFPGAPLAGTCFVKTLDFLLIFHWRSPSNLREYLAVLEIHLFSMFCSTMEF